MNRFSIAAAFLALGVITSHAGEVVMRDSFQTPTGSKAALHGRALEEGNAAWSTTPGVVIATTDGTASVRLTDEKLMLAKVPIPSATDCVVVTAEVYSINQVEGQGGWIAIGLGSGKSANWDGGLFLLLHASGTMECYYCPVGKPKVQVKFTRSISLKPQTTPVKLSFQYEKSSNTLTAWVDDVNVLNNFKLGDFTPNLSYAGFSGFQLKWETPLVNNFTTVVTQY